MKEFAYPIKKRSEGNYTLFYVETEPEAIAELKEFFRITKGILRTLIIKHEVKFPFEMKTASQLVFPERKPRRVVNRGPRVPHAAEQTSETSTEDKKEAPAKEAAPAKTESKEESNVE
ncbi:MAG: hypothetical protein DRP42_03585 [Tenericutes bacterium]|nr:MAG: hypothetical protein DRP42_03585 [Mycoplasmatota bacterium]